MCQSSVMHAGRLLCPMVCSASPMQMTPTASSSQRCLKHRPMPPHAHTLCTEMGQAGSSRSCASLCSQCSMLLAHLHYLQS